MHCPDVFQVTAAAQLGPGVEEELTTEILDEGSECLGFLGAQLVFTSMGNKLVQECKLHRRFGVLNLISLDLAAEDIFSSDVLFVPLDELNKRDGSFGADETPGDRVEEFRIRT